MSVLAPAKRRFLIVMLMLACESVLLVALALASSLHAGTLMMFLIGVCVACNNVPTTGLLQSYSAKEKLGRVMGFNDTISFGLVPLPYLTVSGLLMLGVGHRAIMIVAGSLMFLFCLYAVHRYPVIRATD